MVMKAILQKTTLSLSTLAVLLTPSFGQNLTYTFNIDTNNGQVTKTIPSHASKVKIKQDTDQQTQNVANVQLQQKPKYNDLYPVQKQKQVNQYNKLNTVSRHNSLNETISDLAQRLLNSSRVDQRYLEDIAITSFVDLHKFTKTTKFGRNVSESFFDELFTRGFNVSEFRGQDNLSVNAQGEYFLTRDINLLHKEVKNKYILVGTYSKFEDSILISARIINNTTGRVVASARSYYNTDDCHLLENCPKPRRINIIAEDDYLVKNVVQKPTQYYKETKTQKAVMLKTSSILKDDYRSRRTHKSSLSLIN
jgi:TolB-like protein